MSPCPNLVPSRGLNVGWIDGRCGRPGGGERSCRPACHARHHKPRRVLLVPAQFSILWSPPCSHVCDRQNNLFPPVQTSSIFSVWDANGAAAHCCSCRHRCSRGTSNVKKTFPVLSRLNLAGDAQTHVFPLVILPEKKASRFPHTHTPRSRPTSLLMVPLALAGMPPSSSHCVRPPVTTKCYDKQKR